MRQAVIQKAEERQRRQQPNLTGIPTQMKLDFEQRSGLSFDDVRVHYNSDKPAKIGALAYTQIPEVHIGPGQERHLRHELGHVVQQNVMNIPSTVSVDGNAINNDSRLEAQADNFFAIPQQLIATRTQSVIQGKFSFPGTCDDIFEKIIKEYDIKPALGKVVKAKIEELYHEKDKEYDYASLIGALQGVYPIHKKTPITPYEYAKKDEEVSYEILKKQLKEVYDKPGRKGRPSKTELFQAIAALYTEERIDEVLQSELFVGNLQRAITEIASEKYSSSPDLIGFFDKTKIYCAGDPADTKWFAHEENFAVNIPDCLQIQNFTLRHYTGVKSPPYRKILSSLSLEKQRVKTRSGGHTEDIDWSVYGNVGNTFFVLMIGKKFVCKQSFVAKSPSYVDIPLNDIKTTIWVSSDWLDRANIIGKAFRGTATQIHQVLLQTVLVYAYDGDLNRFKECTQEQFAEKLGGIYNNFEVKVMGPVELPDGTSWVTNPEYPSSK